MAEYYPLLAKAVGGLQNSTSESRRAIYERARKALLAQLRALQPPVPEADVEKENDALDIAIERLEAEFAEKAAAAEQSGLAGSPTAEMPPVPATPPPAFEARPPPARPLQPLAPPRPRIAKSPLTSAPEPQSPDPELQDEGRDVEAAGLGAAAAASAARAGSETQLQPAKTRGEMQRPIAPQAKPPRQNSRGLLVVLGVIGLIIAGVGAAAWKLRDRPEDLARAKSAQTQAQSSEGSGKIIGRVGEDASQAKVAAGAAVADQTALNVPVTYRAAFLVQAPEEQSKVKTYLGTVIWRLDNVSNGPGEPVGTALQAMVDIPEDKLQASVTLRKNLDQSLPASHTMTIVFTVQPSTPTGSIKQINLPQLRKDDSPNGEALAGLPVPIMENSFLVGLSRGASEANNLDLLRTRQWIDIPIVLTNGKLAKMTFEKGLAGQRALDDALASWQNQ